MTVLEAEPFDLELTDDICVHSQLAVLSYLNRTEPGEFAEERAENGPLLWRGRIPGHYVVRDAILKAPEDECHVTLDHEHPRRGEVDIMLAFVLDEELPQAARDTLRSAAFSFMSLLNLKLEDKLTPVAPIQIRKDDAFASEFYLAVHSRNALTEEALKPQVCEVAHSLFAAQDCERLRTALELYGSHFREREARVRFLLLVMALESLATPSDKDPVALQLIGQWQGQLQTEMVQHDSSSPEFRTLDALKGGLLSLRNNSIGSQIRELVSSCARPNDAEETRELVKRAMKVYGLRSTLVHTGHLSSTETKQGESDAREVLEFVLQALTRPIEAE